MTSMVAISLQHRIEAIQAAIERGNTWEPASLRAAESVRIALDTIFHGNRVFRMTALTALAPRGPFGGVTSTRHISASAAHEILKRLYPNDGKPGVDRMDADFVKFLRQIVISDRRAQKAHLLKSRRMRIRGTMTWKVFCPICDGADPTDMHENIVTRGDVNKTVTIMGVVPAPYVAVTRFNEKIVSGDLRLDPGDVLIGTDLARDLGVGLGDKVRLSTPTSPGDAYQVRGIYDLGIRNLNRAYAYVGLAPAQAMHALPGGASSLELALNDLFGAERFAARLRTTMPHEVESWMQANPQLLAGLSNQTIMTLLVRFFLALVVAIGVSSVLVVAVVQKTKEIGILRAMGASRGRILRVFLLQGALIGATGALLGSACGYALTFVMSDILRSSDGTRLFEARFEPELYLYTLLAAVVLGLIAAMMPARRAARLDPAQAIRV